MASIRPNYPVRCAPYSFMIPSGGDKRELRAGMITFAVGSRNAANGYQRIDLLRFGA